MPNPDFKKIEKALKAKSLTEAKLRAILVDVGIPASYTPDRIFPIGIIINDGIGADFEIPRNRMEDFLRDVTVPGLRRLKIFPLGTPRDDDLHGGVDRFNVQMQVARRVG